MLTRKRWPLRAAVLIAILGTSLEARGLKKDQKPENQSSLDRYIQQAMGAGATASNSSTGSVYVQGSRLADLVRDPRAGQVGDIVTILVSDKASATSTGT